MQTNLFAAEQNRIEFNRAPPNSEPAYELALHSEKPETEYQASNEILLTGYARVSVPRDADHWRVKEKTVSNAALIRFPTITAGRSVAAWLSIGIGGRIRRMLPLKEPVTLAQNRRIEFEVGEISIETTP